MTLIGYEKPIAFSEHTRSLAIFVLLAVLISLISFVFGRKKRQLPLPPTPPGHFITGNLFDILAAVSKRQQHLLFGRWAQ